MLPGMAAAGRSLAARCPAACPPADPGPGLDYLLQVNTSVRYFRDQFSDPNFWFQVGRGWG